MHTHDADPKQDPKRWLRLKMMQNKKKYRISSRTAALKRISERRAKSCMIVVVFFGLFATMIVTEFFYVEEERWREENILSMFNFGQQRDDIQQQQFLDPISSRVARELARVREEDVSSSNNNESRRRPADVLGRPDEDRWQRVANTRDKFFVYSAYLDDRRTKWVRVIAAARTRLAEKVLCQFSYQDGRDKVAVLGTNRLIRENWNLKYSAYFILCPLKSHPVPSHVSIVRQGDGTVANKVAVRDNKRTYKGGAEGVAVCIKPLHYDYNKVKNLVEFVELNRILGVDHFVLYNHTVGPEVGCILGRYQSEGIVTVLPWQLDIVSQKEIRTEGLFAALNDCLYRTMYRFRYVLMIDLDEYVVPHRNASLRLMLDHLGKQGKSAERTGAYSFQNAFFYLQWPDDPQAKQIPYKLLTLQKTTRKSKFHAHKQRSKCIVLPERVIEMGNHFVWEFAQGKAMTNVAPEAAFLHHYRVCEFGGNDCINTTHVVDRRAYAWKEQLVDAVALRLRLLQPVCQDILRYIVEL